MKKILTIFILIIYTSSALGTFSINYHYCSGQLAQVSLLNFDGKSGCSCNPDAMPKGCCKDELLCQKVDSHKTVQESYTINTSLFTPDLPPVSNLHNLVLQGDSHDPDNFYNNVRRSSPRPIYLFIRVFRI
ncbi:MAG: hypothetical protein Q8L07_10330 [Sediminibacterium sp.]|nr:hypothetical protein [Sediminibacterium sp.]